MTRDKRLQAIVGKAHALETQERWEAMMLRCDKCGAEGASRKTVTIADGVAYKSYDESHDLCRACWLVLLECLWSIDGKSEGEKDGA